MDEVKRPDKESICSVLMYTMFPSSDYAIQHEIKTVDGELHKMYRQLKESQDQFHELKVTLDKLGNKRIPMDPNGMSRAEAIKSTRGRMIIVKTSMDSIKKQVSFYEKSKHAMETTKMSTEADTRIAQLATRLKRVKGIDTKRIAENMDEVVETNEQIIKVSDTVNDVMSGWDCDLDADEAMLDEYLEEYDQNNEFAIKEDEEEDLDADEDVYAVDPIPARPIKYTAPKPVVEPTRENKKQQKQPVMEYF